MTPASAKARRAPTTAIRRDHALPLYRQLLAHLREQIRRGALAPGDPLPSESELQRRFTISRITVRRALKELQEEGLILKKQGKGSFIRSGPIAHELGEFQTLTEVLARYGYPRDVELLFQGEAVPPAAVAADLEIGADASCILVKRRHLVHREPVALTVMYFPHWLADSLKSEDLIAKTIYEIAEERNLGHIEGRRILSASSASEDIAGTLDMSIGDPVLVMLSRSRIAHGTPVESSAFYFNPRRYSFRFQFSRGTGAPPDDSSGFDL